MMRRFAARALTVCACAFPLLAGALRVELTDPATNGEARAKHAVLVAQTTACHSPEKTTITATAEGLVGTTRQSITLQVIPLATPGTFAVTREWPSRGTWAVKIVARNPEYKNYATAAVAPVNGSSVVWESVQHFFHEPSASEIYATLDTRSGGDHASLR